MVASCNAELEVAHSAAALAVAHSAAALAVAHSAASELAVAHSAAAALAVTQHSAGSGARRSGTGSGALPSSSTVSSGCESSTQSMSNMSGCARRSLFMVAQTLPMWSTGSSDSKSLGIPYLSNTAGISSGVSPAALLEELSTDVLKIVAGSNGICRNC